MTPRALEKLIAPLRRRVALMVGRCVVNLVNDVLKMQSVQISLLTDETLDRVERLQNYGFTANPHPGAEGVALAVGGSRNHTVLIVCDDRRYRLTGLAEGEVAIYDDLGSKIVLKRGNVIEVTAGAKVTVTAPLAEVIAATKVTLTSPLVECTGNATIAGNLAVVGALTNNGVNVGKTHVHGGVQAGVNDSGVPH